MDFLLIGPDGAVGIRNRIKDLPLDLPKAYGSVVDRMDDKSFAAKILGWVLHAQRPLKMSELQTALTFDLGEFSFIPEATYPPESIIRTCGGLIEQTQDDFVRFTHAMVEEYLTENPLDGMELHAIRALTCIAYCQTIGDSDHYKDLEKRMAMFPFVSYAASYWSEHSRLAGRNVLLETKIMGTFNSPKLLESLFEIETGEVDQGSDVQDLLPFLVRKNLAVLVMEPLPGVPGVTELCVTSMSFRSNK
jgi:hypothetical protein